MEKKYYSQYKQDMFVYEFVLNQKKDGYFVDIGAHDGISFSNSYFFEQIGWCGICIEPNPIPFNLLKQNRKTECVQKAITDTTGIQQFFSIKNENDMLSGLVNEFDNVSAKKIVDVMGEKEDFDYINVECDTFGNVVKNKNIDFLSIDTEGNELKILKSIDFSMYNISSISVENNKYDNSIYNFLIQKNFLPIIRLGCDEVYIYNTIYNTSHLKKL